MKKQAHDMMLLKNSDQKRSGAFCIGIWDKSIGRPRISHEMGRKIVELQKEEEEGKDTWEVRGDLEES